MQPQIQMLDTHKLYTGLVESGFSDQQANAIIKTQADFMDQSFVTQSTFRDGITKLDKKMDLRFAEVDKKMDVRFAEVDKKMDLRFAEVDKKMDVRFAEVDKKFAEFEKKMDAKFDKIDRRFDKINLSFGFGLGFLTLVMALFKFIH